MSEIAVAEPPPVAVATPAPTKPATTIDQIMEAAMSLSKDERVELAQRLWESLPEDQEADPAWLASWLPELNRRREEYLKDPSRLMDVDEFFAELDAEDRAAEASQNEIPH